MVVCLKFLYPYSAASFRYDLIYVASHLLVGIEECPVCVAIIAAHQTFFF